MTIISGNSGQSGKLIILREPDWTVEHMQNINAGDFKVIYLDKTNKMIMFRGQDGQSFSYGNVTPYEPVIEGSMYACGRDTGLLGLNSPVIPVNISNFTVVGDESVWEKIKSSSSHVCALRKDGTLWACGSNTSGQLGQGDKLNRSTFTQVGTDTDWVDIGCSISAIVAKKSDGTLWGCGGSYGSGYTGYRSIMTKIGTDTDWTELSVGDYHTMALKTDGTLWVWGLGSYGALGLNDTNNYYTPVQVGIETAYQHISAGYYHSMVIKNDNTLWATGYNNYGQLGFNHTTNRSRFYQVGSDTDWVRATCANGNYGATYVFKSSGDLWYCGNTYLYSSYQSTFTKLGTDTDWEEISAGNRFGLIRKSNNSLWTWGYNTNGQLGQGDTLTRSTLVQVGTASDWSTVSCAYDGAFAIK